MSEAKVANKFNLKKFFKENNAIIIFVLLIIIASCLSPNFLSQRNVVNVLRQQVPYALVGIGCMLVIMTGGIDLSCGAILGVGSVVIALLLTKESITSVPALLGCVVITALVGGVIGLLNGVLVAYFKMAAFIATLAVMTMAQGLAYILTNGQPIRLPSTPATDALIAFAEIKDPLLGVPVAVYVTLIVILLFVFLIKWTSYGRLTIASGSNETAVRLSGINVNLYKAAAYTICGALSALAGIFVTCRAAIGTPATVSGGYELDAIAAVVIGGANLEGGKASVVNTIIGVLIMALIGNIMNLLSIAAYPQKVAKGVIIIAAVLLKSIGNKKQ
ncbi:ABC transporter permease [Lactonifactor longoviformis]|uniref:Ribose transport system permease protein n=1 Tax=Lactonifactor longoviformis DSM 17459 TaxID=1122155 RepID=A0A1M5ABS3_9CLOT|nr:ABC transporter permease [Lactonifactor longoviformis]POP31936.1 ABC transporter permease [Lactonifactor longoviformis]SHF27750.1 ribose transport system permease protein [Lactonifactor longoviformis DSM 17459]